MASGTPKSDALRAQKPLGSSSASSEGAKVSHTRARVSRWISLRTTVIAISVSLPLTGATVSLS